MYELFKTRLQIRAWGLYRLKYGMNSCWQMLFPNCFAKPTIHVIKWELVFMQVAEETETKGQIKLSFKTTARKDVVCICSFQLTQKASKMEYKSIESVLQTINPHTGEVCISVFLFQIIKVEHFEGLCITN